MSLLDYNPSQCLIPISYGPPQEQYLIVLNNVEFQTYGEWVLKEYVNFIDCFPHSCRDEGGRSSSILQYMRGHDPSEHELIIETILSTRF